MAKVMDKRRKMLLIFLTQSYRTTALRNKLTQRLHQHIRERRLKRRYNAVVASAIESISETLPDETEQIELHHVLRVPSTETGGAALKSPTASPPILAKGFKAAKRCTAFSVNNNLKQQIQFTANADGGVMASSHGNVKFPQEVVSKALAGVSSYNLLSYRNTFLLYLSLSLKTHSY